MTIPHKVQQTALLHYYKQLTQPGIKITPENDSTEHLVKLLHTETIPVPLDPFNEVSSAVGAAKAIFLNKFKKLDVHQDYKVMVINEDHQDYMYLNLVTSKPHGQAILDLGAPGVFNPSYLVNKLKLAPELNYHNNSETVVPRLSSSSCHGPDIWLLED
ncbi:hypothetical protein DSO57_1036921 [Entomophthora muscae]|uniref:Uncharacterized protein n=1 Tax=Entomophthora muscae TaxID=34485 RepID=A0ACC2TM91_9FUNG|nr:hypothetical protein DSO57_1036921 [Entomophthora muscae]